MKDEWFLYKSEVYKATGLMLYLWTNDKLYFVISVFLDSWLWHFLFSWNGRK